MRAESGQVGAALVPREADRRFLRDLLTHFSRWTGTRAVIVDPAGREVVSSDGQSGGPWTGAPAHCLPVHTLSGAQAEVRIYAPDGEGSGRAAALERERLGGLARIVEHVLQQSAELAHREDQLAAVFNIAEMVLELKNVQEVLDTITQVACQILGVSASSIRLLDEDTGELRIASVCNLSQQYVDKGPIHLANNPVDAAALEGEVVYMADMRTDPRTLYPEEARREGLVSCLVAGMRYRRRKIGVLRVYTNRPHTFSPFEQTLLKGIATQAAAAVVNARLRQRAIEGERFSRQIHLAADVQRRMIPQSPPAHPRLAIGAVYDPSLELAGDFFDYISLPWGHLGLAVADVVGKGVPASLMMASIRSALRASARFVVDVDETISRINRQLCRDTLIGEFATLFYGVFSPDAGVLTYTNAGHEPPMLIRNGQISLLTTGGLAIGISPGEAYVQERIPLTAGDVLVAYTDGLIEAMNFQGERFGRERFREAVLRHLDKTPEIMARSIVWEVRKFAGLAPQSDDITLVVIRVV